MRFGDEYFGSEAQQTVSRRARDLWRLFPDDPQFSYNGRIMTVAGDIGTQTSEILVSLTRLQGSTACHFLPKYQAKLVQKEVEAFGLSTNIWEFCEGGKRAYEAAKKTLEAYNLPDDITVKKVTVEMTATGVKDFASMAAQCGVLVMSGRVMRGLDVPGITLAAVDQSGQIVGSAWGYKCYHPQSKFSDYALWGGLTCREDRRGQKIALLLGALSIVQLWEDLQVRGFCTGIAADNIPSFSLCEKLGVFPFDHIGLGVTDPALFQGATLTK